MVDIVNFLLLAHVPVTTVPTVTKLLSPGYPVAFVNTPSLGVPIFGVVNVSPARVNAPLPLLCATEVVPI